MNIIGDRLKSLREKRNLQQKNVYTAINVDKSTYSKYENGKFTPTVEILQKLADFFNVSTDYLLGRIEIPFSQDQLDFKNDLHLNDEQLMKKYDMHFRNEQKLSEKEIRMILTMIRALAAEVDV